MQLLQHQQHVQAKKNINHKVPKDAPRLQRQGRAGQGRAGQGRAGQGRAGQGRAGQGRAGQGRAGQGIDYALEKNFLTFESCALLFMLLPSKVVSSCSWESNQATCQSGEWEEPEKSRRHTPTEENTVP